MTERPCPPTLVAPSISPTAARISFAGAVIFVVSLAALHVLKAEMDPSWHFISEYAIGHHGWIMVVAFLALAVSFATLAAAIRTHLRSMSGRAALVLLLISAAGLVLAAVFRTDPILTPDADVTSEGSLHNLGATLGLAMPFAVGLVTWRLARQPGWASFRRRLRNAAVLAVAGFVASLAALALITTDNHGTFGPDAPVGWPNRIEILLYCAWLLTVAHSAQRIGQHTGPSRALAEPIGDPTPHHQAV